MFVFQTELEHGLGFSVLAGKAKALHEKLGVTATQKMKEDLREELVNTLLKTSADHLVSDAPQPIVLANQVASQTELKLHRLWFRVQEIFHDYE